MDTTEMTKEKTREKEFGAIKRIGNTIYFSDRINYETAHHLNILLKQCEQDILDDVKDADDYIKKSKLRNVNISSEPKPIVLILTTHGGLVHAAFSVVDTIQSLRVPVNTVVCGYVASAGTLISLAGTKRFITPNSFMMIHEIRSGFWGRYSDTRVEYENITKLMEHVTKYYMEKTKITKEKLSEMLRADNDLNATECLELGLVHKIE
jgi:ATP-dependent Clp endopeptidase proteolytic subunit ClpP